MQSYFVYYKALQKAIQDLNCDLMMWKVYILMKCYVMLKDF